MILFRSLQPGKFHGDPIVIKPPAVNKDGMAEWRQPGTGFGYAVCGVDLNNDGWVEVLQLPKLVCGCFGPLSVSFAPCRSRLIFLSNSYLACMFCFPISDHVTPLEGIVSFKCRLMHVQLFAIEKKTKGKFP